MASSSARDTPAAWNAAKSRRDAFGYDLDTRRCPAKKDRDAYIVPVDTNDKDALGRETMVPQLQWWKPNQQPSVSATSDSPTPPNVRDEPASATVEKRKKKKEKKKRKSGPIMKVLMD